MVEYGLSMDGAEKLATEGSYDLVREIAAGGMATVFEARARSASGIERRVALKRIHPHLSKNPSFRRMFLDEARIVSRIEHPNVCRILDYGEGAQDGEGAAPFIVMEYLAGRSVLSLLRQLHRQPVHDTAYFRFVTTLIAEAAEGLHAAHQAKGGDGASLEIVHRDISPANLFLTNTGEVKVLDFGVAKAKDRIHVSMTGEIKGKYSYMPPEQYRGQAEARSDVWSLGVVYYELLTLQPLFRRPSQPETVVAVEREPIEAPEKLRPQLAGLPTNVALAALQRNVESRPDSAHAFGELLRAALEPLGGVMSRRELRNYALAMEEAVGPAPEHPVVELVEPSGEGILDPPQRLSRKAGTAVLGSPEPVRDEAAGGEQAGLASGDRERRRFTKPALWLAVMLGAAALLAAGLVTWRATSGGLGAFGTQVAPRDGTSSSSESSGRVPAPAASDRASAMREARLVALEEPFEDPEDLQPDPTAQPADQTSPPDHSTQHQDGRASRPSAPAKQAQRPEGPHGTGEAASAEPEVGLPARIFVPMGVAVCLDRPCRDRSEALFGPRNLSVASGSHRLFYVAFDGEASGPARTLRSATLSISAGGTARVPPP